MNAEDFSGVAADGQLVSGSVAQKEFLQSWIAEENPKWRVWWVIANDGENSDGVMEEWLATGNLVTTIGADGTEKVSYETIDVLLEAGKVKTLNVASQQIP